MLFCLKMKPEGHCTESVRLFGEPFEEVHQWFDQFSGSAEYGMRSRTKQHHLQGMLEVERLFGRKVAEAARQHIISDLKEEGWTEADHFPSDEGDYMSMGFF